MKVKLERLVIREILHRKLNFAMGSCAIFIAVFSFVASSAILKSYSKKSRSIYEDKLEETREMLEKAEDEYRKTALKLGFNVLILPEDQNISDFYADDFASKTMPEEYVEKLSSNEIVTVNHLLPTLSQKIKWPEKARTIILTGTRGEIPVMHRKAMAPMQEPVPKGCAVLGFQIGSALNLKKGDEICISGRKFQVSEIQAERGNQDDITIWINLDAAQDILGKKGQINSIYALECKCAWADIEKIKAEILAILPKTQIIGIERRKARSRIEIRSLAEQITAESLQLELLARKKHFDEIRKSSAFLIPIAICAAAIWIAFLSYSNIIERKHELAILGAMGFSRSKIAKLLLFRNLLSSIPGTLSGIVLGILAGALYSNLSPILFLSSDSSFYKTAAILLLLAPALSLASAAIPSLKAVSCDPAEILRRD